MALGHCLSGGCFLPSDELFFNPQITEQLGLLAQRATPESLWMSLCGLKELYSQQV